MKPVALITGGTKGIGAAIVSALTEAGFTAVSASRSGGPDVTLDVADEASVEAAVARVVADHGRLDVLVNNAGVVSQSPITECSVEEWDHVMDINLRGAFLCSKHAIRHFLEHGGGVIVNVGSVAGRSYSLTASEAYTCSKYGMMGLTKQLAVRWGKRGIRVNAVCPSQTLTPMLKENLSQEKITEISAKNPLGRLAEPEEIAAAVAFMASPAASYLNGAVLDANGGMC